MTNEKLGELVDLQRGIRDFETLQKNMENKWWVRIESPDGVKFRLPTSLYDSFQRWVDEQLVDMKKRFEEG